jgi:hypothetical protein
MQFAAPLGSFKDDAVNMLSAVIGHDRAVTLVASAENYIKQAAEAGARAAIPDIRAQAGAGSVATVRPYLIGAFVLAGAGVLIGVLAYRRAGRRRS